MQCDVFKVKVSTEGSQSGWISFPPERLCCPYCLNVHCSWFGIFRAEFLNLNTAEVLGWVIICRGWGAGGCLVYCRVFNSIPGL